MAWFELECMWLQRVVATVPCIMDIALPLIENMYMRHCFKKAPSIIVDPHYPGCAP